MNKLCAISKKPKRKKALQCVLCAKEFISTPFYENHMIFYHNKIDYPLIYRCEHCPRKFKFKHYASLHMRKHDGSSRFFCNSCPETFKSEKIRRAHIKEAHVLSNIYQCCKCTDVFRSNLNLNFHMETVHRINLKIHKCNKCFALCEYKSAAFVKPAQIVNFADIIFTHQDLHKMIKARQCGDIIKQQYQHRQVFEDISQESTKYSVRTIRKSVRKFFFHLHNGSSSAKHIGNKGKANQATIEGDKGDTARNIVIDSVVSLSNNAFHAIDKKIIIKLERIDLAPYLNREYEEESTDIKLEPLDSDSSLPYNTVVHNNLNHYMWPKLDAFLPQNVMVNMNNDQTPLQISNVIKTGILPNETHYLATTNSNSINYLGQYTENNFTSIYKCKYCISKFPTKKSLASHVDKKHFSVLHRYKCKNCDHILKSKPMIVKHMLENHNSKKSTLKNQCVFCNETFQLQVQLNQHVKYHHTGLIRCSACDFSFTNFFSLKRHMKFKHNHSALYKCEICNAIFPFEKQLKQHISKNKYIHKCNQCNRIFKRSHIVRHINVNRNDNIFYKCSICKFISNIKMCEEKSNVYKLKYCHNDMESDRNIWKKANCNLLTSQTNMENLKKHVQKMPKNKSEIPNMKLPVPHNKSFCLNLKSSSENLQPNTSNAPIAHSIVNQKPHISNLKLPGSNLDSLIPNIKSPISLLTSTVADIKSLVSSKVINVLTKETKEPDIVKPSKSSRASELYICQSCESLYSSNKYFLKKLQLNNKLHIESIDNDLTEKIAVSQICIICNATLHVRTDCHNRVINLHKPIVLKMFKCVICNNLFSLLTKLMNHMRLNHEAYLKLHLCVDCNIIFKYTEALESHRQRQHNQSIIHDNVTLSNKSDFIETSMLTKIDSQMRIVRINVLPREDKIIDLSKLLKCDHCSALFQMKSSLQSHIQLEHMPKVTLHKCCLCSTVFYRITDLDRHLRSKHQLDMELYSGNSDPTNFNRKWKKILTHTYENEKM